ILAAKNPNLAEGGMAPATALYLVGLPLFDMVATTIRRGRRGEPPFQPDRTHIHHILQGLGWRPRRVYLVILGLAFAVHLLGWALILSLLRVSVRCAAIAALSLAQARPRGGLAAPGVARGPFPAPSASRGPARPCQECGGCGSINTRPPRIVAPGMT